MSALVGGGVVVAVIAATVGLSGSTKTEKVVTEVQSQPIAPSNASQTSAGLTPHQIYEKDAPGVVYVQSTVVRKAESSPFGFGGENEEGTASGSGIVISKEGLILTNWHVVENAVKVTVKINEHGSSVEAKVVGKNPSDDLALLKVPAGGLTLHPLKLGKLQRCPGWRPRSRDRQPVQPRPHPDDRRRLRPAAADHRPERLHDQQRDPD